MALWEYKVITSGQHGFASPSLLETHLNTLGKDEWEIIHFQTLPNNPLAFHGLARRSTMRDWTPPIEPVISSPPRSAPEPAAQKTATPNTVKAEPAESVPARGEEKPEVVPPLREETLRPMRDTERDLDPDAEEEDEDWDNWEEDQEDLPTFFEALKPHLRRNQKGPGMSVALDYLAKRWDQREADLVGALKECGFTLPETEESDPDYFEFEGDLYWVNRNNRGQLFINTREKPRPVFRTAQAKKLDPNDPATAELTAERAAEKAEIEKRKAERAERAERQAAHDAAKAAAAAARESGPAISDQDGPTGTTEPKENAAAPSPTAPLPEGETLLEKIRPLMRRNRRGPGYSGSVGFLARALKHPETDLSAALTALGLNAPANAADKPVYVEIGDGVYWMNKDSRGGIWINGREKRESGARNEGNGAETPENSPEGAPGKSDTAEGSTSGESQTVTPMKQSDAQVTDVPSHEIVPQIAEVKPDQPVEQNSGATPSLEAPAHPAPQPEPKSAAASPDAPATEDGIPKDDVSSAASTESEGESSRPTKSGKSTRRPSTRPRTRKAKTDTESEAAPTADAPVVQETDTAKSDDKPSE